MNFKGFEVFKEIVKMTLKLESKSDFDVATKKLNILEMICKGSIPIFYDISEELGFLKSNINSYHLSSSNYLEQLVNIQNDKNISISTFTKGGKDLLKLPVIKTGTTLLCKLKGDCLLESKSDLWSAPDKLGRRWISTFTFESGIKLNFFLTGFANKVFKELDLEYVVEPNNSKNVSEIVKKLNKLDNNLKKQIEELYIKYVTKWLDIEGYKYLLKYLKNNITFDYNEVILCNFVIEKVYYLNEIQKDEIEKLCNKLNLKCGYFPQDDLVKIR